MRHVRKSGFRRFVAFALIFGGAAGGLIAMHTKANACGGLFCNAPPPDPFTPLPVAQNGENVVFAMTKDQAGGAMTLEAHIQILYTGDADKFSWVVPVDAAPVLSVGTDRLFTTLANITQPTFTPLYVTDGTCIPNPQIPTGSAGAVGAAGGTTGAAGTSGAGGAGGGVTVSFQGAVGPFDAAVIQSTDPVALKMWLTTNGYVVTDAASGLIDAYVRENKYFVALKLLNGVGVRSIQPIVLTFRGTEACVPLRLTAIAANPNMPVLVWVFGDKRAAPRAFFEIKIDDARIDWPNRGSNYFGPMGLVSQAANEAGGNAFVTEYAGTSTIARNMIYTNNQFNLTALQTAMTPPVYVQQVIAMGLANDPLTLSLLQQYIPMPQAVIAMGVTPSMFYGNINMYWTQFAFPPYDLVMLTSEISSKIIEPRRKAQMTIDAHPYLTRLNTFISPEEMNTDPFFFETQDLPDVPRARTATIKTMCGDMEYLACNAPVRLELADGRIAWLKAGSKATTCAGSTPSVVGLASLPAAELAWRREVAGEGTRVIDNTAMIDMGIANNNRNFPTEETRFPTPTSPGTGGSTGGPTGVAGSGGSGGPSGVGGTGVGGAPVGAAGSSGGAGGPPGLSDGDGGCGCGVANHEGPVSGGLGLFALACGLGLVVARRRRSL